jgi:hypothetical protein
MKKNVGLKMPVCKIQSDVAQNIPDTVRTEDRQNAPYAAEEKHGDNSPGAQEASDIDGSLDII